MLKDGLVLYWPGSCCSHQCLKVKKCLCFPALRRKACFPRDRGTQGVKSCSLSSFSCTSMSVRCGQVRQPGQKHWDKSKVWGPGASTTPRVQSMRSKLLRRKKEKTSNVNYFHWREVSNVHGFIHTIFFMSLCLWYYFTQDYLMSVVLTNAKRW